MSGRRLTSAAARLFRLLGLHPGRGLTAAAAASLAGAPIGRARGLLGELAVAHLVSDDHQGRYVMHDLLSAYAAELADGIDTDTERRTAQRRLIDHYLGTSYLAAMLLNPHRDPIAVSRPMAGVVPLHFTDYAEAMSWLAAERPALVATIDRAAADELSTHAWQLAWTLGDFFHRRGHGQQWATTQRTALVAARRSSDLSAQAHSHRQLGRAYLRLRRHDDARGHLEDALSMFRELGDRDGTAFTHWILGRVCAGQDRRSDALRHFHHALNQFCGTGNLAGQASALNAIGWQLAQLGNYHLALHYCERALALQDQIGDLIGQANTLDSIGFAHRHFGNHEQAVAFYERSLALSRDLSDRFGEADTLTYLGDAHHAAGEADAARQSWEHALVIFEDLRCPEAGQVRSRLRQLDTQGPSVYEAQDLLAGA